ncbi:MAG: response regulator [Actinomycetota bacterium]|nr:response regulator [Actinomycetota bacterium]
MYGRKREKRELRVLIVDDNVHVRGGLRQLLDFQEHIEVVGECADGRQAVDEVGRLTPDVVVMDMRMPEMTGAEATAVIKQENPDVKVLALTAFGEMELVSEMVKAGADGYLLKGGSADELLRSLDAVFEGEAALGREVTRGVMQNLAQLYREEQERARSLADLDRMKTEFVSVVSHELRTPLTTISGGVTTLQYKWDDLDDATKLELLGSMHNQCDRLSMMIDKILTVSGIQRGGLGLQPVDFSLATVAREALALVSHKAEPGRVKFNETELIASGDRDRIREVAVSLLDNALSFTDGVVEIVLGRTLRKVTLSVRDSGPGIDAQTLDLLLNNPFTQGDSSSTRRVGGLGLSLFIARQVLEASGGRLDVASSPDGGSTFTMVLPAA